MNLQKLKDSLEEALISAADKLFKLRQVKLKAMIRNALCDNLDIH